jgi:hypothetical protein
MPAVPAIDPAGLARLAHEYLAADYRWSLNGDWHDVRAGLPAPGLELAYPQCAAFAMLTAWNPGSVQTAEARNRSADDALRAAIATGGYDALPSFGAAPNRSWREPGWLVLGIGATATDALGRRFGQLATLWWPRDGVVRVRMYAPRPADIDPDLPIDWLD